MSGGRPQAIIDWNEVDYYLAAGCSGREIAAQLGLNPHTIYDRCLSDHGIMFHEYSQQKCAKGDLMLRKAQFDKALGINKDADNTMLVWLGKNRLKQREKSEEEMVDSHMIDQFKTLMSQFDRSRSDLNSSESMINAEQKS
jgi:hypothetical protein